MNKNELINYYTALFIKAYDGILIWVLSKKSNLFKGLNNNA